ncbi:Spy/CpxP family protein refolding chaperone [Microvirga subterranea]|uniref:LTXXQ motif family protein n=1 Tax=Microvirga subterranea TaxID=186651 RepID=A0A370HQ78_9HYPH|nr:Spy/CpxP family protein refolding chaperone [Microvirga subterranea]RDI60693.1 LTXXQ motif family protein [Microvirga subterranea]
MLKRTIGAMTALFILGAPVAYAQGTSGAAQHEPPMLNRTEFKILTDARVGAVKIALQLTPEQEKLWPPVEEAIRARAEWRYDRLAKFEQAMSQQPGPFDPSKFYQDRAEVMSERAANLKKLATAWQPLFQTLTPDQKTRLELLTVRAAERIRDMAEARRMETDDEDEFAF